MIVKTKLKIDTYNCVLEVSITDQIDMEINKVYKKYKVPFRADQAVEGILIYVDSDKYYLMLDEKYLSHNTLAHEIYHATNTITQDRNIDDEESRAWLCGHISGHIYKFLDKKKLIIKHG